MSTDPDQDPGDHLPEFYGPDDGRLDLPDHVVWFRGARRTVSSLSVEELRCALLDAHEDLTTAGRAFTKCRVILETHDDGKGLSAPTRALLKSKGNAIENALYRHKATQ